MQKRWEALRDMTANPYLVESARAQTEDARMGRRHPASSTARRVTIYSLGVLVAIVGVAGCDKVFGLSRPSDSDAGTDAGDAGTVGDAGCKVPMTQCGATCVNLDSDIDNCGACDHACTSRSCAVGVCSYQTVFIAGGTSAGTLGGNLGGLAGADEICRQAAIGASLAGRYMAWLSAGAVSPFGRFTVKSTNPYRLVNQTQIAASWTELTDGDIEHVIDRDANSAMLGALHLVMTNTKADGTSVNGPDCNGWQTSQPASMHTGGATNTNSLGWTENGYTTGDCSLMTFNLYCFEQ